MFFVYLTTNLINGKQYVGSHKGDPSDSYLGSGNLIVKSIKKYGVENFQREILEYCIEEESMRLEEKYIQKYNTQIPLGYNISPTGGHSKNGRMSSETRKKISDSIKGRNHPNFGKPSPMSGKKHTPETLLLMSESRKGKGTWNKGIKCSEETKEKIRKKVSGKNHPNFGKHLSEETKRKISEKRKASIKTI